MFHPDVFELDLHGGANVNLKTEDPFERAPFFIEVDEVGRLVFIDPVLMMVATNEDTVVVPFVGLGFLDRHLSDDP